MTSKKDIANTLADYFSENSSSENYSAKFRKIKDQQEKQKLKFTSDNSESYNSKFSITELTDALSKAHDSSPGPDDIHYQLLKHLPSSTLSILLEIYNSIWATGNIPKSWKEATVIPFPGLENCTRPLVFTSGSWVRASGNFQLLARQDE